MSKKLPEIVCDVLLPDTQLLNEWEAGLPMWLLQVDHEITINGKKYTARTGFKFNMANIPWGFRNTFNPTDPRSATATLWHDANCKGDFWPRKEGDILFRALLIRGGMPKWKRAEMYIAVRVGSGSHAMKMTFSKKYRKKHEKERREIRELFGLPNSSVPLWEKL